MHWVDRGPEPGSLAGIRGTYTPRWIEYYGNRLGGRPTDSRWRNFIDELRQAFAGICGYCEEFDKGEVDHFRPKSTFPDLVYEWSNWIFACHTCNQAKSDKWPTEGYIDPCAESESNRPENYFTFNTRNGAIVPLRDLDTGTFEKAQQMISDLKLNDMHHIVGRLARLKILEAGVPVSPSDETPRSRAVRGVAESRDSDLSSLSRTWLSQRGYETRD